MNLRTPSKLIVYNDLRDNSLTILLLWNCLNSGLFWYQWYEMYYNIKYAFNGMMLMN